MLLPASGTSLYSRTGRQERPTRTSCYRAITVLTSACISDCCTHYYRPHASCVRPLWTAPSAGELSAGRSRCGASVRRTGWRVSPALGPWKITQKAIFAILYVRQHIRVSTQCISLCSVWIGICTVPKARHRRHR